MGADGDVWGVNDESQVWHFDPQGITWTYVTGGVTSSLLPIISQIAVGNDGAVYLVHEIGPAYYAIYWYNPGTQQFQGVAAAPLIDYDYTALMDTIGVGADGDLWSAGQQYTFHYNPSGPEWDSNSGTRVSQISVGSATNVWGLASSSTVNGPIYHWDPQSANWVSVPGGLTQIAAGADGSVWGINQENQVYRYTQSAQPYHTLISLPGSFAQISVGADGTAWGVDANNFIYSFDRVTQNWQNVPGQLAQVSVGSAVDVWGVNAQGQIWRWGRPNLATWNYVPGWLTQIAVNPADPYSLYSVDQLGYPPVFGINGFSQTYVFGSDDNWVNIPGSLAQLSTGVDGSAWGINAQQQIYRYDADDNVWVNVPGSLVQIAVGSAEIVWGVNQSQQVYRYDTSGQDWVLIPNVHLTQIAAAFDGAVWGVDAGGSLYQWVPSTQTFELQGGGVTNVVIGNDNVVFAYNRNTGATYYYY